MKLLLEIGVEEVPAQYTEAALAALAAGMRTVVAGLADPDAVRVTATPRRLVAEVEGVAAQEPRREAWVRGPAESRARDADGSWSQAARGFAAAQGCAPEELVAQDGYLYARKQTGGRSSLVVLQERLPGMLAALRLPRTMRWGTRSPRFVRPIRWLLALLGSEVIPFTFAGVSSGRESRGLRYSAMERVAVPRAEAYRETLTACGVLVDRTERRERIRALVAEKAEGDEPVLSPELLAELTDLCEQPTVLRGTFPGEFLELPEPVLATTMIHHQRFVPVRRAGRIHNAFLAVANGGREDVVRGGNERVLRARLADAVFFFEQDRARPLAAYLPELDRITYVEGAGTLGQRARRLEALAGEIAAALGTPAEVVAAARRAGLLAEADRATQMVRELPELGGVMGSVYARLSGEPDLVVRALAESVLPPAGGGELPQTPAGQAVALAARLDHVAAGFVAQLQPRGSADPYGLRRAAIGALRLAAALPLDLAGFVAASLRAFSREELLEEALDFFRARLASLLADEGTRPEVAEAVLAVGFARVDEAFARARALQEALAEEPEALGALLTAYRRAQALAQPGPGAAVGQEEELLARALDAAQERLAALERQGRWEEAVRVLAGLKDPLDRFFAEVLVMAPEPEVRRRRQALLQRVVDLTRKVADFGAIPVTVLEGTS